MSPSEYSNTLQALLTQLFTPMERTSIEAITLGGDVDLAALTVFDLSLGGPSCLTMTAPDGPGTLGMPGQGAGRYAVADRDVFRPLQYSMAHLMMVHPHAEWLARSVVESSSAHIEALVKRIGGLRFLPLGTLLRKKSVAAVVSEPMYSQALCLCEIYNASKHDFAQDKDTHMFSLQDAVAAYFAVRRLALRLYPLARLSTDPSVFDVEPATYHPLTGRIIDASAK